MKFFSSFLGALLAGVIDLFAQTNYTCTFSANVEMDSIQVKNTVSEESKMLYYPDNTITLQQNKPQGNEETSISTIKNANYLQQISNNAVTVSVTKPTFLYLTLYSIDGKAITHYSESMNIGQHTFQIDANAGVYVLVATTQNQSSTVKISLS